VEDTAGNEGYWYQISRANTCAISLQAYEEEEQPPMPAHMRHQHYPRTGREAHASPPPQRPLESLAWGLLYGGLLSLLGWSLTLRLLLG
jgi:hypothetical protein